jgi:hypothetical protein
LAGNTEYRQQAQKHRSNSRLQEVSDFLLVLDSNSS